MPLSVNALGCLLMARFRAEKVETYKAELQYLLVTQQYGGVTRPSDFVESIMKPKKKVPDGKIVEKLIEKLRR